MCYRKDLAVFNQIVVCISKCQAVICTILIRLFAIKSQVGYIRVRLRGLNKNMLQLIMLSTRLICGSHLVFLLTDTDGGTSEMLKVFTYKL